MKFESEFKYFHWRKYSWKCHLGNVGHFSRSQCLKTLLLSMIIWQHSCGKLSKRNPSEVACVMDLLIQCHKEINEPSKFKVLVGYINVCFPNIVIFVFVDGVSMHFGISRYSADYMVKIQLFNICYYQWFNLAFAVSHYSIWLKRYREIAKYFKS